MEYNKKEEGEKTKSMTSKRMRVPEEFEKMAKQLQLQLSIQSGRIVTMEEALKELSKRMGLNIIRKR